MENRKQKTNTKKVEVNSQNNFEGKSQDKNFEPDTKGNHPRMEEITRIQKRFLQD